MRTLCIMAAMLGLLVLTTSAVAGEVQVSVINDTQLSIALQLTPGADTEGGGVTNLDAGESTTFHLTTPLKGTDKSALRFSSGNNAETTVTITSNSSVGIGFIGVDGMSYSVSREGETSCVPDVSTKVKEISSMTAGQTTTTYGLATVHITKCGSLSQN